MTLASKTLGELGRAVSVQCVEVSLNQGKELGSWPVSSVVRVLAGGWGRGLVLAWAAVVWRGHKAEPPGGGEGVYGWCEGGGQSRKRREAGKPR